MHALILSIFASVIPARYRGRFLADSDVNVQRGAVVSGAVQMALFAGLVIYRYFLFMHARTTSAEASAIEQHVNTGHGSETFLMGSGVFALLEYLIQPVTIIFCYLILEGLMRTGAALVTNEIVPSLPFQSISWLHSLANYKRHRSFLGPRIADIVTNVNLPDHTLRIESCRTKPWDMMMTVDYIDVHYELVKYEEQGPPRRFIYLLRPIPPNKLIRGLHRYDPNEELNQED